MMDNTAEGGERRHVTWRDLPPSPPLGPIPQAAAVDVAPPAAATVPAGSRTRRRAGTAAVFGAGLLAGVLVLVGAGAVANGLGTPQVTDVLGQAAQGKDSNPGSTDQGATGGQGGTGQTPATPANPGEEPLADTAAKLLPSVVQIETGSGLGSGFIADASGLILTASHVVGTESRVTVRLQDGTTLDGQVVAADRTIDTAVVKVDGTNLVPATLGSSADVRVGQVAIAVGSPFGFDQTVTTGIISGLGRTLDTEVGQLTDLIQTDAPINQGNSGGPLADKDGRVIGINTAIASQTGGSNGVGFAVPIDAAKDVLQQVKDGTWTADDNQPADIGGAIPGLPFDLRDFQDLLDPNGPLGPNGLFGPDGLFGGEANPFGDLFGPNGLTPTQPDQTDPSTPGGSDQTDQLFRWLFNYVLPQIVPQGN